MAQELLATDPAAGVLLSADPKAGAAASPADRTNARMSAATPGTALPAFEVPNDAAFIRSFGLRGAAGIDVTLNELKDHPIESMQKIGVALKRDATDPTVWLGLAAAYFGPKVFKLALPTVMRAVKSAGQSAGRVASAAVDAADADLVSIASPRAGAALKKAQQAKDALKARSVAAEATTPAAAPDAVPPASALPAPSSAPSASPTLKELMQSGMRPTEAARALKLLRQGVDPAEVQARILSARPSAPSVTPGERSPIQRSVNIKPGVEPSPSQVANGLALAARRAKVTLSAADEAALTPLVKQGMAPEAAIQQLPTLKMQSIPGTMTDAEVAAEIAARKGNRSPTRD